MIGDYKRSKLLAEREVDAAWARGLPVVVVSPSTPVGDGDIKPTPTGKIIVDFLAGRFPAYVDTGLNLIDVRDVAAGHLLAAERGRPGERYILANANVTLKELLATLARIAGRAAPRLRLPHWVPLAIAHVEAPIARLPRTRAARPARRRAHGEANRMFFDGGKAVRELGLPQSPIEPGPAAGGRVVPAARLRRAAAASAAVPVEQRAVAAVPRAPSAQARTRWRSARSWGKADGCAKSRAASSPRRIAPPSSRQRLRRGGSASAAVSLIARRISQGRPARGRRGGERRRLQIDRRQQPGRARGGEREQALLVGDGGGEARDRDQGRRARACQLRGPGEPAAAAPATRRRARASPGAPTSSSPVASSGDSAPATPIAITTRARTRRSAAAARMRALRSPSPVTARATSRPRQRPRQTRRRPREPAARRPASPAAARISSGSAASTTASTASSAAGPRAITPFTP